MSGQLQIMRTQKLDEDSYLSWLTDQLRKVSYAGKGDRLLHAENEKGLLESHHGVRYRYGEYNVISMLPDNGADLVERLRIVNGLGLTSFPVLVEAIEVEGGMFVVTYTPGTRDKDLSDDWKVSDAAKQKLNEELKILLAHGYAVAPRISYRQNSSGDIIIPTFHLLKIEEHQDMLFEIYCDYRQFCREEWTARLAELIKNEH